MRSIVLVLSVVCAGSARAQTGAAGMGPLGPARDVRRLAGTAGIRGRVVATSTGQPLRRATVRASSPALQQSRTTTTDRDGRYELTDLPAGRYSLSASKGGHAGVSYGQTKPFGRGQPVDVRDGQTVERVDFALPLGSVIAGRIIDEFGEPLTNVRTVAMRARYLQGRRQLTPTGRAGTTNDIGEFRIFGLSAGQYYVSATLYPETIPTDDHDPGDRSGYAPTYYPGTGDPAGALPIGLGIGETSYVGMTLVPAQTARISGTALTWDGRPMLDSKVTVSPRSNVRTFSTSSARVAPDGTFSIAGLPPGDYVLRAERREPTSGDLQVASAQVGLAGGDQFVPLTAARPVRATGRIVSANAAADQLRAAMLQVTAVPIEPDDAASPTVSGEVNDDLTFEVKAAPGRSLIRVTASSGWALRAVRLNGFDVTDRGIEFRADEDLAGIEIELTNHPTHVLGVVANARGQVMGDCSVVVFSSDERRWSYMSRYVSAAKAGQDGRFDVRTLPPGEYLAVALDDIEPGQEADPDFLEAVRPLAKKVSLAEGQTAVVDLRLVTSR